MKGLFKKCPNRRSYDEKFSVFEEGMSQRIKNFVKIFKETIEPFAEKLGYSIIDGRSHDQNVEIEGENNQTKSVKVIVKTVSIVKKKNHGAPNDKKPAP